MNVAFVAMPCGAAAGRRCGAAQLTTVWSAQKTLHVQSDVAISTCIAVADVCGIAVVNIESLFDSQGAWTECREACRPSRR